MKKLLAVALILFTNVALAEGWSLRQVKINHTQSGNGDAFFFSFSGETKTLSECDVGAWGDNWGAVSLSNLTEQKKYLISLAMSAQASGKLVDIGGVKGQCLAGFGNVPEITYIRVGNYLKK